MSIYEYKTDSVTQKASFALVEKHLYGASRLGVDKTPVELIWAVPQDTSRYTHILGLKNYELGNHLGNVGAVVSDRKVTVYSGGVFDHWKAEVLSATDYYPFGMQMPGRTFNPSEYDHGFQGMHKGDEIKGVGRHYSTEFREYDPLIGRWWSIDPLAQKFAWQSPYVAFDNNPINKVDPHGDESHEGKQRAETAKKIDNSDNRKYGKGDDCVDCSKFTQEVEAKLGVDIPRVATDQADYFKQQGEFSTDIKDAKEGDHIFFKDKSSLAIKHTGIVQKRKNGTLAVTHATVNNNEPGSIKESKLSAEGNIIGWDRNNIFVGVGRPKLTNGDATTVNEQTEKINQPTTLKPTYTPTNP